MVQHPQINFRFDNSYARLPEHFFARLNPMPVATPKLIALNRPLACELGLNPDALILQSGIDTLAGNRIAAGSEPIAMAYAGHQFGSWVPQLGDGRAHLLGEVIHSTGKRMDIQLKGSGQTPFSRQGDGRAWIGPVLREYLLSEAMFALHIPTTRALAAIATGEDVFREQILPGAILTRVAGSHIRVGTFQYFASRNDTEALQLLANYVIDRHFPDASDAANPYLSLLEQIISAQATLIAQWMGAGFIHGVMNTDNMLVCGETIDYGPCAFMDHYHPDTVFSSIDHFGRYAYDQQPGIAQWNLAALATAILPLMDADRDKAAQLAQKAVNAFADKFEQARSEIFNRKIGLQQLHAGDDRLVAELLQRMSDNKADFTLTFRRLSELSVQAGETQAESQAASQLHELFTDHAAIDDWLEKWRTRLAQENQSDAERQAAMRAVNPAYIPRNHRVEAVIQAALNDDYTPFETLLGILSHPFDEQPQHVDYQQPPKPEEVVQQTFCGT